jgi:UDP-N-acetyl-D-glucosamine dehydrogenase
MYRTRHGTVSGGQCLNLHERRCTRFRNIDDVRESPALDVIELLRHKGADVRYHDPYVSCIRHNGFEMEGEPDLAAALAAADCAVVVTDHSSYDWGAIKQQVRLIVDTRHAVN